MDEQTVKEDAKIESSSSLPSNDFLTSIYDITRAIFRHLPIRSIDSCASVCQSWAHIARLTLKHRHTIHTLTYPLSPTTTWSGHIHDFDTFISSYIKNNLWSIPSLALLVATNKLEKIGFYSSSSSPPPTKNPRRRCSQTTARHTECFDISHAFIRHLNKSCKVLTVASYGIIASNDENQSNEIESGNGIGILLLPKLPSDVIGIYPFEIPRNARIPTDMSRSDLHRYLGSVPDDIPIRCVISFFIHQQPQINDFMKKLLEYYSSEIVLIGGFVNKTSYDDRQTHQKKSASSICGIALTGDPKYLHIRQVVLDDGIQTREGIREKLKQLKSIENKSYLSFAIQVTCIARGANYYKNEQNVECSEFRKLFPNTPLIGIFGNGEYGHDYLPNADKVLEQETSKASFLTYSTVFSLISFCI